MSILTSDLSILEKFVEQSEVDLINNKFLPGQWFLIEPAGLPTPRFYWWRWEQTKRDWDWGKI